MEHGVALVWDGEGSCHIGRASVVSSWVDYSLKGIGRDKKIRVKIHLYSDCRQLMPLSFPLLKVLIWCISGYIAFVVHPEALVLSSRW